jgi:hypothetical protein
MKYLLQLLSFWTLFVALFLFKTHKFSETEFCLRLKVEPALLGPIDTAVPISGHRHQSQSQSQSHVTTDS